MRDPTPKYWAPARNSYNTSLGDDDGSHHLKVHRLRWRWTEPLSLAWMCAARPGDHNVEIEATVYPSDSERWSDNWESNSARKYTQHNGPAGGNIHQDDLADGDRPFDGQPGNYPLDKQRYPDFSIIFQSSQEFRYGRLYKVRFVTNEGETDTGRVIYSQQATHHVATRDQDVYCLLRGDDYKSCMFGTSTVCVDHAQIAEAPKHANVDWENVLGTDATRMSTVRKSRPGLFQPGKDILTARCDPRPSPPSSP